MSEQRNSTSTAIPSPLPNGQVFHDGNDRIEFYVGCPLPEPEPNWTLPR